jgi:hypothetical protein
MTIVQSFSHVDKACPAWEQMPGEPGVNRKRLTGASDDHEIQFV